LLSGNKAAGGQPVIAGYDSPFGVRPEIE